MDIESIKNILIKKFGDDVIESVEENQSIQTLIIKADLIQEVCLELKSNPATYFDYLTCLTGIDLGLIDNMFAVHYNITSIPYNLQLNLRIKKYHNREESTLPFFKTVSTIWKTAEWHEREAYDLVGIYFEGHPDLRRILLPDDWEGYPLRKDYKAQDYYHGIKVN